MSDFTGSGPPLLSPACSITICDKPVIRDGDNDGIAPIRGRQSEHAGFRWVSQGIGTEKSGFQCFSQRFAVLLS